MRADDLARDIPPTMARWEPGWGIAMALLLAAVLQLIFVVAPTEATMGDVQRIVYLHVAVAWFGLLAFVLLALCGAGYLVTRHLGWDHWAVAAAEMGWMCSSLTLITGSLWAHEAWNTWWTWDPRLTTSLILWVVYSGYFILRASLDDGAQRARLSAVLGILGLVDVPLVVMSTRWFRGMHPESPDMEPAMHAVLGASIVVFTVFFVYLLHQRRNQLRLEQLVSRLEQRWTS